MCIVLLVNSTKVYPFFFSGGRESPRTASSSENVGSVVLLIEVDFFPSVPTAEYNVGDKGVARSVRPSKSSQCVEL